MGPGSRVLDLTGQMANSRGAKLGTVVLHDGRVLVNGGSSVEPRRPVTEMIGVARAGIARAPSPLRSRDETRQRAPGSHPVIGRPEPPGSPHAWRQVVHVALGRTRWRVVTSYASGSQAMSWSKTRRSPSSFRESTGMRP